MNEESTVLPDAREGSPTAPRGAPEAWWAGAAPRPFGGSQSGGGLPPREADGDSPKISFGVPPLKFALGRGREVRRCPVPRLPHPARAPHPAYRGRCLGAQPAGRSGRAEDSADARAARLRAPPHTALPPIARPSPCHQYSDRPTPPDAARACSRRRVGGRRSCHQRLRSRECRAAEMRVAGRCGRRRRGRGVCASSMRRARADR